MVALAVLYGARTAPSGTSKTAQGSDSRIRQFLQLGEPRQRTGSRLAAGNRCHPANYSPTLASNAITRTEAMSLSELQLTPTEKDGGSSACKSALWQSSSCIGLSNLNFVEQWKGSEGKVQAMLTTELHLDTFSIKIVWRCLTTSRCASTLCCLPSVTKKGYSF